MICFLDVIAEHRIQFYSDASALPYLDANIARAGIVSQFPSIRSSADAEVGNVRIVLSPSLATFTALRLPPIGAEATLYGVESGVLIELLSGIIESVELSSGGGLIELRA